MTTSPGRVERNSCKLEAKRLEPKWLEPNTHRHTDTDTDTDTQTHRHARTHARTHARARTQAAHLGAERGGGEAARPHGGAALERALRRTELEAQRREQREALALQAYTCMATSKSTDLSVLSIDLRTGTGM